MIQFKFVRVEQPPIRWDRTLLVGYCFGLLSYGILKISPEDWRIYEILPMMVMTWYTARIFRPWCHPKIDTGVDADPRS